jgi:hypothetical protein
MTAEMFEVVVGEAVCCCGLTWERDPALEVVCPVCGAAVGQPCPRSRPSGHSAWGDWAHNERDFLAMDTVKGYVHDCPGREQPEDPLQPRLVGF